MRVKRISIVLLLLYIACAALVSTANASIIGTLSPVERIHRFDWDEITLPVSVCSTRSPVPLYGGIGLGVSAILHQRALSNLRIEASIVEYARYGDLNSDGRDEAALTFACSIPAGTIDSVYFYRIVIFSTQGSQLTVLGILRAKVQRSDAIDHSPTLLLAHIEHSKVIVKEDFYGRYDAPGSPTGRAVSVWRYRSGVFKIVSTTITRTPLRHV